jgi:RNA polymerase sigma factor (sigma-70 family)
LEDLSKLYRRYYYTTKEALRKWDCPGYVFDDIYQDVFSILLEKQKHAGDEIKNPLAYIIQMCRLRWYTERKKMHMHDVFDELDQDHNTWTEEFDESRILLLKHLKKLPATCREILTLYFLGYNEYEICRKLNMDNPRMIRNRKYYCKEKLRDMIMNDPAFDEINE